MGLSGHLDYTNRDHIEKWFHTLKMRIDRLHHSWVGSRSSVREWLEQFMQYGNYQRPHQALGAQTGVSHCDVGIVLLCSNFLTQTGYCLLEGPGCRFDVGRKIEGP